MTQAAPPEASSGRVIVLGSINVDLLVSAPRLPHAGETVPGSSWARELGGKGANLAVGRLKRARSACCWPASATIRRARRWSTGSQAMVSM